MTKRIAPWIVLVVLIVARGSAAFAQAGAAGGAAVDTAPRTTTDPVPPGTSPTSPPTPPGAPPVPPPTSPPASGAGDPRKACSDAMNADPQFAASIVKTADERAALQRDKDTLAAHKDANLHVQKNERHVIYAYAVMWMIAAGFVIFLSRRQQALQVEIANLKRDLEAMGGAADEGATVTPGHILFIPGALMIGLFVGFILGARAARNQFELQQKRDAEREATRAARAAKRAAQSDKPAS